MTQNIFYRDFDVPTDLKFKTVDIVHMGGLRCSCLLTDRQTEGMLEAPNRITQAKVELSFTLAAADILVRGTIHGKRYVECARCLTFTEQPFREEFTETYSHKTEVIDIMYLHCVEGVYHMKKTKRLLAGALALAMASLSSTARRCTRWTVSLR